nr:hypothetical protein GOBAR_DD29144 [Ipomoea batatas]
MKKNERKSKNRLERKGNKKQYIPSRRGALALTLRALVEILRRVFGGDHSNLEHQVVAAGSDSGDAPPLEESLDAVFDDFPGDFLRVSRQVVIRRESDVVKKQDEAACGLVKAVTSDVCRMGNPYLISSSDGGAFGV